MFNRIKHLCDTKKISPSKLAITLGYSKNIFTELKSGRTKSLPLEKVTKIANYFEVSPQYILFGASPDIIKLGDDAAEVVGKEKSVRQPQGSADTNTVTVIDYSVIGKVRAGYGGMAQEEYTDETCPIPSEYIKGHEKDEFFVLRISGNSMYPKLLDGDKVLVQRCTSVDSGAVAIVLYDSEEATVKTVRYAPNQDWVELIPTNPEYQTKRIEGPDLLKVQILGKVTKLIRDI